VGKSCRESDQTAFQKDLQAALDFTSTYQMHRQADPSIREAWCLASQYKSFFESIQRGDRLAGRVRYPLVGFGTENTSGGSLYYCKKTRIRNGARQENLPVPEEMLAFWQDEVMLDDDLPQGESLHDGTLIRRLPADILSDTSNTIANMGGRIAGACLDYDKLVRLGIPGLRAEVMDARENRIRAGESPVPLYDAMLLSLEQIADICLRYAKEARAMADSLQTDDGLDSQVLSDGFDVKVMSDVSDLHAMADVLEEIACAAPKSFRAGLQLLWIYALASLSVNYGRMDIALGDLLAADLDTGRLTEEEALSLLESSWRLMVARRVAAHEISEFNARVIVGGMGRRNPDNADRFALLAMEASRRVVETEPQLTLRVHRGMNPALMEKAMSVLGEGRVYPMLYNDDVNVPAVMRAFGVTGDEALDYVPYGCGEYAIDHQSIGSPNCSLNLLKALEAALHNGFDVLTGLRPGLSTGNPEQFDTFDRLWSAYAAQVEHFIEQLGRRHLIEYEVERETASLNLISLLYDGTVASGRSVLDHGTRHTGSIIESFGMVNAADSLTAIRTLVYERKLLTLAELTAALDAGFEGQERVRRLCLSMPKYGNDMDSADDMLVRVSRHACEYARQLAPTLGFDYFLLVNINNYYNVALGKQTAASADGRETGGPLANGSTPTAGMDRQGVTAMLRSLAKIPADNHAGYSHNMKFAKSMFRERKGHVAQLLEAYFKEGGTQAMLTVVDRHDLEDALLHPEKHHNLIVRVGGFSARFVELAPEVQQDILKRTLHEG